MGQQNGCHDSSHPRPQPSAWRRKAPMSTWETRGDPFGGRGRGPLSERGRQTPSQHEEGRLLSARGPGLEDPSQSRAPASGSRLVAPGPGEEEKPCFLRHTLGRPWRNIAGRRELETDPRAPAEVSRSGEGNSSPVIGTERAEGGASDPPRRPGLPPLAKGHCHR